jgi:hypothetical protein
MPVDVQMYMYVRKKVICEQGWRNHNDRSTRRDFTARRSWTKSFLTYRLDDEYNLSHVECVMYMQMGTVYSLFTDFDWIKQRLQSVATLIHLRTGEHVYRVSDSRVRSAVKGPVFRECQNHGIDASKMLTQTHDLTVFEWIKNYYFKSFITTRPLLIMIIRQKL